MRPMYIVAEYLLLENFLVNYLILYINTHLLKISRRNLRLIGGAFIASLYSLIYFYPLVHILMGILPKTIFSILIILIAYEFTNIKTFIKSLLGFYLVTFLYGGASLAFFYSSKDIIERIHTPIDGLGGFPLKYLILGAIVSTVMGKSIFTYFNEKKVRENYIIDVTIVIKGKAVELKALLDTGHSLRDPFTGKSVFVVEYRALKSFLPGGLEGLIKANEEGNFLEMECLLNQLKEDLTLTLVPFNSLGKSGILFAFKPDKLIIQDSSGPYKREDMLVGLYGGSLSKEMGYRGLLNYEFINGGIANEQTDI